MNEDEREALGAMVSGWRTLASRAYAYRACADELGAFLAHVDNPETEDDRMEREEREEAERAARLVAREQEREARLAQERAEREDEAARRAADEEWWSQ